MSIQEVTYYMDRNGVFQIREDAHGYFVPRVALVMPEAGLVTMREVIAFLGYGKIGRQERPGRPPLYWMNLNTRQANALCHQLLRDEMTWQGERVQVILRLEQLKAGRRRGKYRRLTGEEEAARARLRAALEFMDEAPIEHREEFMSFFDE